MLQCSSVSASNKNKNILLAKVGIIIRVYAIEIVGFGKQNKTDYYQMFAIKSRDLCDKSTMISLFIIDFSYGNVSVLLLHDRSRLLINAQIFIAKETQ